MKATGACKIIGYALDNAAKEGEIQVFADAGESSAGIVTKMQDELNLIKQENKEWQENARGSSSAACCHRVATGHE